MRSFRSLPRLVAIAAVLLFAAQRAPAQLHVDVVEGHGKPMPVAVVDFFATGSDAEIGAAIAGVVAADLERSGLFAPIDPAAFIQSAADIGEDGRPRFGDWRTIDALALVSGWLSRESDGRLKVSFRLWDTFGEEQLDGYVYRGNEGIWRRIAHKIADAVYERITGESGYFDTRVVYVAESGPATDRSKRLAIMDQDGANHRFLTDGSALVLTPRFSPTAQEITYLSYVEGRPRVYLYNIDTGRKEVVGNFPGMTFAPRFSPDGNKVVMSMAQSGNSEIYTMDLRTRRVARLTRHPAIDTSPSYAPDGRRVVFNSDRGGSQQLYVMDADGEGVRRISFGQGKYATPVWSPRGDLIAFTRVHSGTFSIGVMRPDGNGERILAEGFLVEGPTWAPNGRILMFFRQQRQQDGGKVELVSIDLTGHNERRISTPLGASDPAWSPLRQ